MSTADNGLANLDSQPLNRGLVVNRLLKAPRGAPELYCIVRSSSLWFDILCAVELILFVLMLQKESLDNLEKARRVYVQRKQELEKVGVRIMYTIVSYAV